jgi:hypothetical protein
MMGYMNSTTASALLRLAEKLERAAERNEAFRRAHGWPAPLAEGFAPTRRRWAAELRKQAANLAAQPKPQTTGGADA